MEWRKIAAASVLSYAARATALGPPSLSTPPSLPTPPTTAALLRAVQTRSFAESSSEVWMGVLGLRFSASPCPFDDLQGWPTAFTSGHKTSYGKIHRFFQLPPKSQPNTF